MLDEVFTHTGKAACGGGVVMTMELLPAIDEKGAIRFDRRPRLTYLLDDCDLIADHLLTELAGTGVVA